MASSGTRSPSAAFALAATLLTASAVAVPPPGAVGEPGGLDLEPTVTMREFTLGSGSFGYDFVVIADLHIAESKKLVDGMEDFGTEGYDDTDNDPLETTPPVDAVVACIDHINSELVGQPGYDVRFVVVAGDVTSSAERSEWQRASTVLAGLDGRVFTVPLMGNHDGWPYVGHGLSFFPPHPGWFLEQPEDEVVVGEYFTDAFRGAYDSLRSVLPVANWEQGDWMLEPTSQTCHPWPSYYNNFAFSYQGSRFIITDFNTRKDPPPSERPGLRGEPDTYAGAEYHWTMDWLEAQLAAVPPGERIICVGHHAYFAAYSNFQAGELQHIARAGLLNRRPTAVSIGGHVHPFGDQYGRLYYGSDTVCDYYAHNAAKDGNVYVFHVRDSARLAVTHAANGVVSARAVQFDGSYEYEGTGNAAAEFRWDFGDGSPPEIAGPVINHEFAAVVPDTLYKVSLRVTTASGRHLWACDTVRVLAPWLGPQDGRPARRPDEFTPGLSVIPNPLSGGHATLRYSLPSAGAAVVNVYDVTGRSVLSRSLAATRTGAVSLDVRSLSAGIYLVRLDADRYTTTSKLVVQK